MSDLSRRSIWKFPFPVTDEFTLAMPRGAKLLHVETQRASQSTPTSAAEYEQPCLWALVYPDVETEGRTFYVHGTGHPVPDDGREHVGSFLLYGGSFVGHLFTSGS